MCEQNDELIREQNVVYLTTNNKNGAIVWSFLGAFLATNNEYCGLDMLTRFSVFLWILVNLPQIQVKINTVKKQKRFFIFSRFTFYIILGFC